MRNLKLAVVAAVAIVAVFALNWGAHFWPPLKGRVTAGAGVTGKLGTIKRSDGSTQATYNGHPLYTYVGDSKPGQDNGNNLNLSGGVWHVVPASGT